MADATSTPSVEETLAWEAEHRPRAGWAGIGAGFLLFFGGFLNGAATRDRPRVPFVEVLARELDSASHTTSLRLPLFEFFDDHRMKLILSAAVSAISYIALGFAVAYLIKATAARRPELPKWLFTVALVAPIVLAASLLASQLILSSQIHHFVVSSDHTSAAANDVGDSALLNVFRYVQIPATLAAGLVITFGSINAMRVGLLTRFMGILGAISGVALVVLPQNPVASFWLIGLGALFLGRWPGGAPPAWDTGRAEPWPTQQQLREARQGIGPPLQDAGEPGPAEGPAGAPHPTSKKRKRKRR